MSNLFTTKIAQWTTVMEIIKKVMITKPVKLGEVSILYFDEKN